MKTLRKILIGFIVVIAVLGIVIKLRGDEYLMKGLWATYLHGEVSATIDDAKYFKTKTIEAGKGSTWGFAQHSDYRKKEVPQKLQQMLDKNATVAFVVIQNDSILYEQYESREAKDAGTNSFSMAKSITTMLTQIAIQKGILQGWHQKVKTLLPEMKGEHADEVELWHLSTMSSGLDWDEDYSNPWTITAKTYYGNHVKDVMLSLPIANAPGKKFNYQSGSTELLALCLMKATGKTMSGLASDWLWKPLQAERNATWHTDDDGTELCWCCFNSNAKDFARFGKMMLHKGNWNGVQILDSSFVQLATAPALAPEYGYSFWLDNSKGTNVFFQWGFCGQYIITIPEYNVVVVRLGRKDVTDKKNLSEFARVITEGVLEMVKK